MKMINLVLMALVVFAPLAARAFSISPSKFTLIMDPGEEQVLNLTITNSGKQNTVFKLTVVGAAQDAKGRPVFLTNYDEAEKWIKPPANSISLKAGQKIQVSYAVKAPEGAPPKAHYLGLAIQPEAPAGKLLAIEPRLISLVLLQVSGIVKESLLINKWRAENGLEKSLSGAINLELYNNGNVPVAAKGRLTIINWFSKVILRKEVDIGNALSPGSIRILSVPVNLPAQNFGGFGFYRAKLNLKYGQTGQIVGASARLWHLPFNWRWLLAALMFILLIISLGMWRLTNTGKGRVAKKL